MAGNSGKMQRIQKKGRVEVMKMAIAVLLAVILLLSQAGTAKAEDNALSYEWEAFRLHSQWDTYYGTHSKWTDRHLAIYSLLWQAENGRPYPLYKPASIENAIKWIDKEIWLHSPTARGNSFCDWNILWQARFKEVRSELLLLRGSDRNPRDRAGQNREGY